MKVDEWEWMWAPYDRSTYQFVLEQIDAADIVLEIGAGDLRLSRQMAQRAAWVYALEQNQQLFKNDIQQLPANMQVIVGDARSVPFPADVTTAVLLMRHCTHFSTYFDKLLTGSCRRILTNARWGMDIESIDLRTKRIDYTALEMGWFACRCGNRGFKPGAPESINYDNCDHMWELNACPDCSPDQRDGSDFANRDRSDSSNWGMSWLV